MRLAVAIFGMTLGAAGCGEPRDIVSEGMVAGVRDLVTRAPSGFEPYLASEWQLPGSNETESIPTDLFAELQRVSRLEPAPEGLATSGDSTVIVLYLFRPLLTNGDSVRVLGGWMGLTGGAGEGPWGNEYSYHLGCATVCLPSAPETGHHWN